MMRTLHCTIGRQQPVTQVVSVGHCDGATPYVPHAMYPVGQL
jgi:hypothetical protein